MRWQALIYAVLIGCWASTFLAGKLSANEPPVVKVAPLPFAITSFGAARTGDQLYVYGGNMASAHTYWNKGQSDKLLKLDLKNSAAQWEEVSTGARIQGLAMVAHQDRLIIIGGFSAMNEEGQKQDLRSSADVRAFNVVSKQWSDLPALPEPRSSHDAAMIGDTVYVVGGWKLAGQGDTTWHQTAWSLDLSAAQPQWIAITPPPFKRRAVAAIEHEGKLFVVGGMNEEGGPTRQVALYDPKSKTWTEGPELVGEKEMAGFGVSGWSIDGKLIVTTHEGAIEQLDSANKSWQSLGHTSDARFFHRILPLDSGKLIAIGGANMGSGKFLDCEVIPIAAK